MSYGKGSRTSKLKVISPRPWGFTKVNVYFGKVRPAEDQTLAFAGDLLQAHDGSVWEFAYRENDFIRGYPIKI